MSKANPFMEARYVFLHDYLSETNWKSATSIDRVYMPVLLTRKQIVYCLEWAFKNGRLLRRKSKRHGFWWWYEYKLDNGKD